MKKHILTTFAALILLNVQIARAHCPLCTLGAAAAAGGAAYLGVSNTVIGIFIGAFAISIGWWFGKLIKRRFIPYQKLAIIIFSFFSTVLPMMSFLSEAKPLYLPWLGAYGKTFVLDMFLIGSILGGIIVSITPWMSKKITVYRNGKIIPYQGIMLTLSLLIITGIIIQIIL